MDFAIPTNIKSANLKVNTNSLVLKNEKTSHRSSRSMSSESKQGLMNEADKYKKFSSKSVIPFSNSSPLDLKTQNKDDNSTKSIRQKYFIKKASQEF